MTILAVIPSPTVGALQIGPISLRAYAVCIIIGIIIAVWLGNRRIVERGGQSGQIVDIAVWAVPFGIIGGRIYHVLTTPEPYFGPNGHLIDALKIWNGGLGIWGAIALGYLGAYIGARKAGFRIGALADALAPGLALAQAAGRVGNYFNNELYGGPTDLPWRLRIYEWNLTEGKAVTDAAGNPVVKGYFQPTFLYELIWNVIVAGLVIWLDRKLRLGHGRAFALYVALYCVGRFGVEKLRTDEAEIILGQRLNVWTSIIIGLVALAYFFLQKGGRELSIYRAGFVLPGTEVESGGRSDTDQPAMPDAPAIGAERNSADRPEPD